MTAMDDGEDNNVAERGGDELMSSAKFKIRSAVSGQPRRRHRASCGEIMKHNMHRAVGIIRGSGKWLREPFQLPTNPEKAGERPVACSIQEATPSLVSPLARRVGS